MFQGMNSLENEYSSIPGSHAGTIMTSQQKSIVILEEGPRQAHQCRSSAGIPAPDQHTSANVT